MRDKIKTIKNTINAANTRIYAWEMEKNKKG
jgi:hypothetical protein